MTFPGLKPSVIFPLDRDTQRFKWQKETPHILKSSSCLWLLHTSGLHNKVSMKSLHPALLQIWWINPDCKAPPWTTDTGKSPRQHSFRWSWLYKATSEDNSLLARSVAQTESILIFQSRMNRLGFCFRGFFSGGSRFYGEFWWEICGVFF